MPLQLRDKTEPVAFTSTLSNAGKIAIKLCSFISKNKKSKATLFDHT